MRRAALAVLACLWLAIWLPGAALALSFPALSGRVVDEAGILDAGTEAELTQTLAELEARTTDQLVIVTLKSLQDTSIEDFGYQLGRHWGIGQKERNNGALLIVAPNERQVRIETGYGVEGALTDAIAKVIIESSILPRFRAGDFPGGIRRGVEDIVQVLSGDAELWRQRAAAATPAAAEGPTKWQMVVVVLGVVLLLIFCAVVDGTLCRLIFFALLSGGGSGRRSSGGWGGGGGFGGGGGSFGGGGSSGRW